MAETTTQKQDDVFDISTLAIDNTVEMVVNHPVTGEPTTWVWIIAGPGHPARVQDKMWLPQESVASDDPIEEQSYNNAFYLAKNVLSWTPVRINGVDVLYNYDNVVRILRDQRYLFIYQQLLSCLRTSNL